MIVYNIDVTSFVIKGSGFRPVRVIFTGPDFSEIYNLESLFFRFELQFSQTARFSGSLESKLLKVSD